MIKARKYLGCKDTWRGCPVNDERHLTRVQKDWDECKIHSNRSCHVKSLLHLHDFGMWTENGYSRHGENSRYHSIARRRGLVAGGVLQTSVT